MPNSTKTAGPPAREHDDTPAFTRLADLASARVGGRALASSDDFFAPRANLLKPEPAIFVPGKFTSRGKWMDGWESRRRRSPGHDWCVVALGMRGRIRRRRRRYEPFRRQPSLALLDRSHRWVRARHGVHRGAARRAMEDDPRRVASAGQLSQLLPDRCERAGVAPPLEHLPGRRRRSLSRLRRRPGGLDARGPHRPRSRPCEHQERRPRARRERHALRRRRTT